MPKSTAPTTLLFVCMGNICRSPTAHGVMRHKALAQGWGPDVLRIDSAGTHNYHPGAAPDPRSLQHAVRRGYAFADLRARQLEASDFASADLILVMDWDNLALAQSESPPRHHPKIRRLTEFCESHDSPVVPDPYYGGERGFEEVLDLVEDACEGLLRHVRRELG